MQEILFVLYLLNAISRYYSSPVHGYGLTERYQFTSPSFAFFETHSKDVENLADIIVDKECKMCPLVYLPVCGSDNVTYTNECRITCYNQFERNKTVPIVHKIRLGPCKLFVD